MMENEEQEERVIRRQKDAVAYLQGAGFKISLSKFNRDFNAGCVACRPDKTFEPEELIKYAQKALAAPEFVPDLASNESFSSQKAAVEFLRSQGFKVNASRFSRDFASGLIKFEAIFQAGKLMEYAQRLLEAQSPAGEEQEPAAEATVTRHIILDFTSDSGNAYRMEAIADSQGNASLLCSCPAALNGLLCKHRMKALAGDFGGFKAKNEASRKEFMDLIASSRLPERYAEFCAQEQEIKRQKSVLETEHKKLKKGFGRLLESGR